MGTAREKSARKHQNTTAPVSHGPSWNMFNLPDSVRTQVYIKLIFFVNVGKLKQENAMARRVQYMVNMSTARVKSTPTRGHSTPHHRHQQQ